MVDRNIEEFRRRVQAAHKKSKHIKNRKITTTTRRKGFAFPWMTVINIVVVLFLLKAFVVIRIGEKDYRAQLASYVDPAPGQKIGIFLMSPDPVTMKVRTFLAPIIQP